jgi:hypothetical protein
VSFFFFFFFLKTGSYCIAQAGLVFAVAGLELMITLSEPVDLLGFFEEILLFFSG